MSFRPNVHDELTLNGVTYRIAEHPAAPGIPYGQEGRAGIVYCLERSPLPSGEGPGVRAALKVFKPRFRTPALVALSARLNEYAQLPGLRACERTVLTPENHPDLLRCEPDLTYAVLMPWIEGPTWFDILQEKRPLPLAQSLALASSLTRILTTLEQQVLAHCDLSAPNVLLPALVNPQAASAVELVDVEQMYGLGLPRPESLSSGTAGYAPAHPTDALWSPNGDRFAGAILLADMLGWCDENVRQAAWGESYFDPAEIQQDGERYRVLHRALEAHWGKPVADLFERAWTSETLADCPTFGEWQLILPATAEIQSAFETTALVSAHTATGTALAEAPQVLPWAPRKEESFDAIFRNAIEAYRRREWALARELLIPLVQEAPNYVLEGYTPRALLAEVERQSRRRPVAMWILLAVLLLAGIAGIFGAGYAGLREFPAIGALLASPTPTFTPSPVPTYTPYPTATPYPTFTPYPTPTPAFTPTPVFTPTPTPIDMQALIKSSDILVYEDVAGLLQAWVSEAIASLSFSGGTIINVGDAVGNFKSTVPTRDWDLIIVAAEARNIFSGELFESLYNHINNGGAIIIEEWYLDQVGSGKIAPILSQCGVRFFRNWERKINSDPYNYSIYWLDESHPLLSTPNRVKPPSYPYPTWIGDVGDLIALSGSGDATLVGGLFPRRKSDYGVLATCLGGRMVLQTFSTHDYLKDIMLPLWQNYIIYTLTNHYKYLYEKKP
jgi:serine/threonine protein kinase